MNALDCHPTVELTIVIQLLLTVPTQLVAFSVLADLVLREAYVHVSEL